MMGHHLAQLDIGRLRAPLGDPAIAEVPGNLARINALAQAQPGFVRRLQHEAGDATGIVARCGSLPCLDEAKSRLDRLAANGPTAAAFTFSRAFTADGLAWRRG